ncbi:MAG: hypothetical protein WCF54_08250 [Terracidiphilus sp.]
MEKVVMTFNTIDAKGKQDGYSLDVEFAVDQTATPKNSVTHFKLTSTRPASVTNSMDFYLTWGDAAELEETVNAILSVNPIP